jgi:threonine dehydrogenase-like Zn-dependent dehydrogenase
VAESTSKLFKSGDKVLAIPEGDQGLAECFVALSSKAVKLDPAISDAGAACIIQPLSTVMNAMDRMGDIAGQSVAVIGLGSIGLFFCWLAAKRGAGSVVGVDPCAERCRIAESLGANRTISKRSIELIHAARKSPDIWNPPDICVEAVGHQMDTLNDCLELVRKRGSVIAFGVPDHPVYALEYETFFRKNAILIATVTPDWSDYLTQARDLFLANSSALTAGFITHRLPIGEAEKVFEMYERHENGVVKAVLNASCW